MKTAEDLRVKDAIERLRKGQFTASELLQLFNEIETLKSIQSDAIESTVRKCAEVCDNTKNGPFVGSESPLAISCDVIKSEILSIIPQKEKKV